MADNDWLTVNEAANRSGYHPEYIRRLIREKEIKARKVSIVWVVDSESLQAYIQKAQNSEDGRYKPKGNYRS